MKSSRLSRSLFARPTLQVARELLGKFLVRKIGQKEIAVMITETEAYVGPHDLASHASRGRTRRTEVMFGPPGHAYVYLIYGMYHCLNIVTGRDSYPAAVLIRGAMPSQSSKGKSQNYKAKFKSNPKPTTPDPVIDGPGKLCRYLQIDKNLNGEDLITSNQLWLEDRGVKINPGQIKKTKRIGVNYAGKYKDKLWRFMLVLDENGKRNNKKTG